MSESILSDDRLMFAFAHDLRGYLRTILTRIQMIQTDAKSLPERDQKFLEEAAEAAGHANGLLTAMVSYCGVTASPEKIDLGLMLRSVSWELKPVLAEANAELSVVNGTSAKVPAALQAVVKELLINACRFRPLDRQPVIQILTRPAGSGALEVAVADNGLGVDPEWTAKIFQPFHRLNPRNEYPGYGLGLALCRRIVEGYGGVIGAAANAGGGLTVTFTVPAAEGLE